MLHELSRFAAGVIFLASVYGGTAKAGTNLFKDGGFEMPATPAGGYTLYSVGQKIGNWTVVGPAGGTVATVSTSYQNNGITFNAQRGLAYLNLAGNTNEATGVSQRLKLSPGKIYKLFFSVGNVKDPSGGSGCAVVFSLGGQVQGTYTNNHHVQGQQVWKRYNALEFYAQDIYYTFQFVNGSSANHNNCGLDSVGLTESDR